MIKKKCYLFEIGEMIIYNGYRNVKIIDIDTDGFYILETTDGWRKRVFYKTLNKVAEREYGLKVIGGN